MMNNTENDQVVGVSAGDLEGARRATGKGAIGMADRQEVKRQGSD